MTTPNIGTSHATLNVEVTIKADSGKIYDVATLAKLLEEVIGAGLDSEDVDDSFMGLYDALTIAVVEAE